MKTFGIACALGLVAMVTLVGCERTEKLVTHEYYGSPDIRLGSVDPAMIGLWLLEDGEMLPDLDTAMDVTAFEFAEDGRGRVWFRDLYTNANDCVRAYCVYDGATMVLDLSREPSQVFNPERAMSFPVVVISGDELSISDENNEVALLSRQTSLPPEIDCGTLPFVHVFTGLPRPNSFGDLVLYEGDLVFNSTDNLIERFDLDTQSMLAPLGPTSSRFLQTTQSVAGFDQFWTHCGCGGSPDVFRRDLVSVYDTIHTGNDLGEEITVRAGEWLPTTARLWLHGFADSDGRGKFLVINSGVEPDVLQQTVDFNRSVRGLTFDGTDLWAFVTMASRSICRIDISTGKAVESFELPDEDIFWTGMEFDENGLLYVIGVDENLEGVIMSTDSAASVRNVEEPLP